MKKLIVSAIAMTMVLGSVAACQKSVPKEEDGKKDTGKVMEKKVEEKKAQSIKVAAIETGYGREGWEKVAKAFEAKSGIKVDLVMDKELEDVIGPQIESGDVPDFVHLGIGRKKGLTERMIKSKALADISDVYKANVFGENVSLENKLVGGMADNNIVKPYDDGKQYMAPTFYSPTGFFYNANFFKKNNIALPSTFDEFFALADKAKEHDMALFAYPTAGYFDATFYGLLYEAGGAEFFKKASTYQEGVWDTEEAKMVTNTIAKIASFTHSSVPANANGQGYKNNQGLVMNDQALFMPNGTWVVGEMKDAPRVDGFEWGFMALPALKAGGDRYAYTFFEQAWIPKEAKNMEAAKKFLSYLYSDEAAGLFVSTATPAVQPIKGLEDKLTGDNKLFYSVYKGGVKAAVGAFAATEPVEGVNMQNTAFENINSLVTKDIDADGYLASIKEASDKLRAAIK